MNCLPFCVCMRINGVKVLSLPEEKFGTIRYEFQTWDNPQWL